MKLGLKVAEIPTIEGDRIGGKSRAKSIPVGLAMSKLLIKEMINKNIGTKIDWENAN